MNNTGLIHSLLKGKQFEYSFSGMVEVTERMSESYELSTYKNDENIDRLKIVPTKQSAAAFTLMREGECSHKVVNEINTIITEKGFIHGPKAYEARMAANDIILDQYCSIPLFELYNYNIKEIKILNSKEDTLHSVTVILKTGLEIVFSNIKELKLYVRREVDFMEKED